MASRLAAGVLAFSLAIAPLAAVAQTVVVPADRPVTAEDAREIAEMHGVVRIDSIELNRLFNQWQVDGYDFENRYVEIDIDTNTGTIKRLDR